MEFTPQDCDCFAKAIADGAETDNADYVEEVLKLLLRGDIRGKVGNVTAYKLGKQVLLLSKNQAGTKYERARIRKETPFPDRVASVATKLVNQWKRVVRQNKLGPKGLARLAERTRYLLARFRAAARQLGLVLYWQKKAKLGTFSRKRAADELLFGLMRSAARVARARVAKEFGSS